VGDVLKTLFEIITEIKAGQKPDYDDLRYSVLALDALLYFDSKQIRDAAAEYAAGKVPKIQTPEFRHNESFRRNKAAFEKNPKQYVGWNNDPENPEYLKRVETSIRLFKKIVAKIEAGKSA